MVWACFSVDGGLGPIAHVQGTMNRYSYIQLLTDHLLPYIADKFERRIYFFQDDNASVHTAQAVQRWLRMNDILELANWPSQSLDLNPIENLWGELERRLKCRHYQPTS